MIIFLMIFIIKKHSVYFTSERCVISVRTHVISQMFLAGIFLPQNWQWWGVSPVCHITWFIKCSLRVNDFLNILHRSGVSPVCSRTWFTMCSLQVKVLVQNWQLKKKNILNTVMQILIALMIVIHNLCTCMEFLLYGTAYDYQDAPFSQNFFRK